MLEQGKHNNTEGQGRRQRNITAILDLIKEFGLPMPEFKLVSKLSYQMNLSPDTIRYSFLSVFYGNDILKKDTHDIVYWFDREISQEKEPQKISKKCKNCDKPIQDSLTFCSKECLEAYKNRKELEK